MSALTYWVWLSALEGVSPRTKAALVRRFGDAEKLFFAPDDAIAAVEGVEAVEVSLHEGRASIKGSPSEADVLLAVERIGFKARKATNK